MKGDHPRACGAHFCEANGERSSAGSSPRMRGSRDGPHQAVHRLGIIPAHAGLTTEWAEEKKRQRDHPRACGAHVLSVGTTTRVQGSSPRMRGSLRDSPLLGKQSGIIPAHAGLTCRKIDIRQCRWDHPRACGAHMLSRMI